MTTTQNTKTTVYDYRAKESADNNKDRSWLDRTVKLRSEVSNTKYFFGLSRTSKFSHITKGCYYLAIKTDGQLRLFQSSAPSSTTNDTNAKADRPSESKKAENPKDANKSKNGKTSSKEKEPQQQKSESKKNETKSPAVDEVGAAAERAIKEEVGGPQQKLETVQEVK